MVKAKRIRLEHPRSFHSLTEPEITYLAALWDGEGCFYFDAARLGKYYPLGQLGMSDARLYHFLKEKRYAGSINASPPQKGIGVKIRYFWYLIGEPLKEFLEVVAPYMVFKKDQALLLLEAFKYKGNKEKLKEMDVEIRRLKEVEQPVPEELKKGAIAEWLKTHDYSMSTKGRHHVYRQRKRKVSI